MAATVVIDANVAIVARFAIVGGSGRTTEGVSAVVAAAFAAAAAGSLGLFVAVGFQEDVWKSSRC